MPLITRAFEFDAGHRILGHESKCAYLHGHRYRAEISIASSELDALGRVADFGVIKKILGEWIDMNLDHTMILHPDDPLLRYPELFPVRDGRSPFIMPIEYPSPTAENIAHLIFDRAQHSLHHFGWLKVWRVVLYETPNSWAEHPGVVG